MPPDMPTGRTMAEILADRAQIDGDRCAYTFLVDGDLQEVSITYGALDRWSRALGHELASAVEPGARALLLFPSGLDYVAAFFACLLAGVVAVPVYPPRLGTRFERRDLERIRAVARDAGAEVVLTSGLVRELAAGVLVTLPELASVPWLAGDAPELVAGDGWSPPRWPDPVDLAFLQYTSGSTGTPRGVMVRHANLIDNQRMIQHGTGYDRDDRMVSWLPLYHDLGLIGATLQPCFGGFPCVFMGPEKFLARPARWVEAISRHGGTTGGAPNFAYELLCRRTPPETVSTLDLSRWRLVYNGGEPIRPDTLQRMVEFFGSAGFRSEGWFPVYGLAEATVYVAGGPRHAPPRLQPLAGRTVVGSTLSTIDQDARIVDPDTGCECPPGQVGELWLAGPHVCDGYWAQPEATEATFGARLVAEPQAGPFLRTGDLAFVDGGEVYLCGRIKDLVIVDGRNHHPHDLERAAEEAHPACRPGSVAAFSVPGGETEHLVVVQEVRESAGPAEWPDVIGAVRTAVAVAHEVRPRAVVLVAARTIPKTSSGKIQRGACRQQYLGGGLEAVACWPEGVVPLPATTGA